MVEYNGFAHIPKGEPEIGMEGDVFPAKKVSISLSRFQDKVGKRGRPISVSRDKLPG